MNPEVELKKPRTLEAYLPKELEVSKVDGFRPRAASCTSQLTHMYG